MMMQKIHKSKDFNIFNLFTVHVATDHDLMTKIFRASTNKAIPNAVVEFLGARITSVNCWDPIKSQS
jgi:hypothetical protein